MRNSIIVTTTAISILFAVPAQAAEQSARNEVIGVSSGAVIGAVAGGPVGLIIGATIGAKVGETVDHKNTRIAGLQDSVSNSQSAVASLERDLSELGGEVERLQNVSRPELLDLMQAGIEMDLLFRTDEAALADSTQGRLKQLASMLAGMPDLYIQLDGFADERCAADYNQTLSERRVALIRDQFVAAGVDPVRINSKAHGEAVALAASPDSFALERRVSVKLFIDDSPSLAANPN